MNADEFLNRKPLEPKFCGCGCGCPLEENDPDGPKPVLVEGKTILVNSDCYYTAFGKELDALGGNVGGLGVHGPKSSGPID